MRSVRILVASVALLVLAAPTLSATGPATPQILSGTTVPAGKYPSAVAIFDTTTDGFNNGEPDTFRDGLECGGVLIHKAWVLTAAHCVQNDGITVDPSERSVFAGSTNLRSAGISVIDIDAIEVHPLYSDLDDEGDGTFDAALLHLSTDAEGIPPAPLATLNQLPSLKKAPGTIVGWGCTNNIPDVLEVPEQPCISRTNQLQQGAVALVENKKCDESWPPVFDALFEGPAICAIGKKVSGTNAAIDSCAGDGGGPLFVKTAEAGTFVAGIAAFGGLMCGNPDVPSVYTSAAHIQGWAQTTLSFYGDDAFLGPAPSVPFTVTADQPYVQFMEVVFGPPASPLATCRFTVAFGGLWDCGGVAATLVTKVSDDQHKLTVVPGTVTIAVTALDASDDPVSVTFTKLNVKLPANKPYKFAAKLPALDGLVQLPGTDRLSDVLRVDFQQGGDSFVCGVFFAAQVIDCDGDEDLDGIHPAKYPFVFVPPGIYTMTLTSIDSAGSLPELPDVFDLANAGDPFTVPQSTTLTSEPGKIVKASTKFVPTGAVVQAKAPAGLDGILTVSFTPANGPNDDPGPAGYCLIDFEQKTIDCPSSTDDSIRPVAFPYITLPAGKYTLSGRGEVDGFEYDVSSSVTTLSPGRIVAFTPKFPVPSTTPTPVTPTPL